MNLPYKVSIAFVYISSRVFMTICKVASLNETSIFGEHRAAGHTSREFGLLSSIRCVELHS